MHHIPGSKTRLIWQNTLRRGSSGPLEHAAVPRDAERYFGLDLLHGPLVQLEQPNKVGVIGG